MERTNACIVTLPITPAHEPRLGLMVIPFVMDVLGKKMGLQRILALNVNGAKLHTKNAEEYVAAYLDGCQRLNIFPNFTWRDDQGENVFWINTFFHRLLNSGSITKSRANIMRCVCGAVESIADAENISESRRLYHRQGEKLCCIVCNGEIRYTLEDSYFFVFPATNIPFKVFPKFYGKELQNMAEKFRGKKLLVSRSRPSALRLWTGEEQISIDVDFAWQMLPAVLRCYGYEPMIVVGSSRNLLGCLLTTILSHAIDAREIQLVIPPYLLAPGREELQGDQYAVQSLAERHSPKVIRLLLATAMNWRGKEAVLEFELAKLIGKMSYRINAVTHNPKALENALSDLEAATIKRVLAEIRGKREVCAYEQLYGIL